MPITHSKSILDALSFAAGHEVQPSMKLQEVKLDSLEWIGLLVDFEIDPAVLGEVETVQDLIDKVTKC